MKHESEGAGLEQNGKRASDTSSQNVKGEAPFQKANEQQFIPNLPNGHMGKGKY